MKDLTPIERVVQAIASKGDKFALEVLAGISSTLKNRMLTDWMEDADGDWQRRTQDGVLIAQVYRNKKRWIASIPTEGCGLADRVVSQHGTAKRARAVLDQKLPRYGWKMRKEPGPP